MLAISETQIATPKRLTINDVWRWGNEKNRKKWDAVEINTPVTSKGNTGSKPIGCNAHVATWSMVLMLRCTIAVFADTPRVPRGNDVCKALHAHLHLYYSFLLAQHLCHLEHILHQTPISGWSVIQQPREKQREKQQRAFVFQGDNPFLTNRPFLFPGKIVQLLYSDDVHRP